MLPKFKMVVLCYLKKKKKKNQKEQILIPTSPMGKWDLCFSVLVNTASVELMANPKIIVDD